MGMSAGGPGFLARARDVFERLTAEGDPWVEPINRYGDPFTERGSGLHGQHVPVVDGTVDATWTATATDHCVHVSGLGCAPKPGDPFLYLIEVNRLLQRGDQIRLTGPWDVTLD